MSTEETRYYLNGIALQVRDMAGQDRFTMAALDGSNLAAASRPLPAGAELLPDVILPRKAVAVIGKAAKLAPGAELIAVEFDPAGRGAGMFRFEFGPVVIQAKAIDGTFPDWSRVFSEGNLVPSDGAACLFPELLPGAPVAALEKLAKAANLPIDWQPASRGLIGSVASDPGLIFGAAAMARGGSDKRGMVYQWEGQGEAWAYLLALAETAGLPSADDMTARCAAMVETLGDENDSWNWNGGQPYRARPWGRVDDRGAQFIQRGGEVLGLTVCGQVDLQTWQENVQDWEALCEREIHHPAVEVPIEGSYSIVMPRERAQLDPESFIDGPDGHRYPVAIGDSAIALSKDQVRALIGESCFGTIALTIAGRAVYILQWLFDQGDNRFLTVRPDGRCYSGKDAWRAEYLSRETVEAALRGEELPEPVEIASPEGAESESEPCAVLGGGEVTEALSGPEIEPEAISDNSGNIPPEACDFETPAIGTPEPVAAAETSAPDSDVNPFAELAARVAAIEARLAAPLSGESSRAEAVTPTDRNGRETVTESCLPKRTAAHERMIRRAWAERKAARAARFMIQLRTDLQANAERGKQHYRERMEAERVKRLRSTLLARQRGKQMAVMAGMIAAKVNAYSEAELQAAVVVERERAAELQRDLDQARADRAGVADGAGVAAAQAAAQMERAMQAEEGREALRADLDRERAALAAVTERNARLLQGMADLAERVERAEAAIAA